MSSSQFRRVPIALAAATTAVVVVLAAATMVRSVRAQTVRSLETIESLSCSFPVGVSVTWENREPRPEVKREGMLTFKIDEINVEDGSARFIAAAPGTNPEEEIVVRLSGSNLHFMDIRSNGELNVTTVFAKVSRSPKLRAVYTHTAYVQFALPNDLAEPEVLQRYGECEIGS